MWLKNKKRAKFKKVVMKSCKEIASFSCEPAFVFFTYVFELEQESESVSFRINEKVCDVILSQLQNVPHRTIHSSGNAGSITAHHYSAFVIIVVLSGLLGS